MPTLPRIARGPADLGRRASPADFGAGVAAERAQTGQLVGQIGGEAAAIGDRILQASQQAKLARSAAELSAAEAQLRFDLETDPDLDTQEERYEKASKDLLEKARTALPSQLHGQLDDRVFAARAHGMLELRHSIRRRRIDGARADTQAMLDLQSNEAARTGDPLRRAQIRGQVVGQLDQQMAGGILDQAQYDKVIREFDRGVGLSDVRRLLREDPVAAFRRLSDPGDPISQGFDQAEIEQFRTEAANEQQQRLAENRAAVNFAQGQDERRRRLADEAAVRTGDDLLAAGRIPELQQFLAENRETLTPEHRRFYLDRIASGGGFDDTVQTDPAVYIELSRLATQGVDILDQVDGNYRAGRLSQSDRDALQKVAEDKRFGDARRFLQEALRVGDAVQDPGARAKSAKAMVDFNDWSIAHPDATRAEADKMARQVVKDALLVDLGELTELRPTYAVMKGPRELDVDQTGAATEAARQRGELDEFEYKQQKRRIVDWSRKQRTLQTLE